MEDLAGKLREKLASSQILTESSPGYEDAIKRWSDAAVKRAVGLSVDCRGMPN